VGLDQALKPRGNPARFEFARFFFPEVPRQEDNLAQAIISRAHLMHVKDAPANAA